MAKHFDFRNSGLTEFPTSIFDSPNEVEVIDLSGNDIETIPDRVSQLSNLKIFFCSNNQVREYPKALAKCPNLKMVSFKENQIEHIPDGSLGDQLRWLILTNNQITSLPETFGKLTQLEKLALAGNQLTHLPESITNCTSLGLARISANKLTDFPEQLLALPQLAWLAFDGNPFTKAHYQDSSLTNYQETDFEIGEILGEGASGVIRRAFRKSDQKPVAIKLFKGEITSDGRPQDERNNCIAAGHHPNLVDLLGAIQTPSALVFELVSDNYSTLGNPPSLETCTRDVFNQGFAPSLKYIKQVISDTSSALAHLHQSNILHGDFYAHNMMTNPTGKSILSDFGASSSLLGIAPKLTNALMKIESRAIGYLIDDLLKICPEQDQDLASLRDKCLDLRVNSRPLAQDVFEQC